MLTNRQPHITYQPCAASRHEAGAFCGDGSFLPLFCRLLLIGCILQLAGCASREGLVIEKDPEQGEKVYVTESVQRGIASYYYGRWIGRKTANGEIYRASDVTAAHRTLPFNTKVRVTNLRNGKQVIVRINNRGPFIRGRIIDLSLEAARRIDMTRAGIVPVKVEVLKEVPVVPRPTLRAREGTILSPEPTPTPTPRPRR